MQQHTPKLDINVTGKMNAQDAGSVGKIMAVAGLIFATCAGLALLLHVIRWW